MGGRKVIRRWWLEFRGRCRETERDRDLRCPGQVVMFPVQNEANYTYCVLVSTPLVTGLNDFMTSEPFVRGTAWFLLALRESNSPSFP